MKDDESETTVRVSPGVAAAQAVPDGSQLRNYARLESESQATAHGD